MADKQLRRLRVSYQSDLRSELYDKLFERVKRVFILNGQAFIDSVVSDIGVTCLFPSLM